MSEPATFKLPPLAHQLKDYEANRDKRAWGLFWEMGCGKSKEVIDHAAHLYRSHEIGAMIVVAPAGVEVAWAEEQLPIHMPDDVAAQTFVHTWRTVKAGTQWHAAQAGAALGYSGLVVACCSYNAVMTEKCAAFINRLLERRKVLFVLDESHAIKNPNSKRTKRLQAWSKRSHYRRILTGTPSDDSPFDVFAQVRWLDSNAWSALGIQTPATFRAHFGVWEQRFARQGGQMRPYEHLIRYRNLNQLHDILQSVGSRVRKDEVLDLPPKTYQSRYFHMSAEGWRVYRELEDECSTFLGTGEAVTAALTITRYLRLQQVTSGYVPADDDQVARRIEEANPRVRALLELMEEAGGQQGIVWAKYRMDLDFIQEALRGAGYATSRYDGTMSEEALEASKSAFMRGETQVFVANPSKARQGHTLNEAKWTCYYNNSFKLNHRIQSEDRNHRIGQESPVQVYDLCALGPAGQPTIDGYIVQCLRNKKEVADEVHGDKKLPWV